MNSDILRTDGLCRKLSLPMICVSDDMTPMQLQSFALYIVRYFVSYIVCSMEPNYYNIK